ncbi:MULTISPECIES: DUF559 domain-containing protein [Rhodomicrobium]|uniref:endonuclease domain-containing protein n=1 Tax=Rhodomicrobium TaxID=1068 RepID=UPI001FD934DC|nr:MULTISPECIES: DUF559 domain-containing protein [Rhodomicrobium]
MGEGLVRLGTKTARRLRRDQTDAERALWAKLRNRRLCGARFARQVPIDRFIVDFLCDDARLILELDGGQHAESRSDEARTAFLEGAGFSVLRFWNNDVLANEAGVLERIRESLLISGTKITDA